MLVLKYILGETKKFLMYGVANAVQNCGIMLSAVVLWIGGTMGGDEYDYQLTL